MSNLSVKEINHPDGDTNEVSIPSIDGRMAKAWANFVGTDVSTFNGYNISSITDNGTGDYTVNFTNELTDTNYAVVLGASNTEVQVPSGGKTTISVDIETYNSSGSSTDSSYVHIAVFGD